MRTAQYYRDRIAALKEDIEDFGAAGDDLQRLRNYEQDLRDIEEQVPKSTGQKP